MKEVKDLDLTGQRFNHLVAIEPGPDKIYPSGLKRKTWLCLCDCQQNISEDNKKLTPVPTVLLQNGEAKSCGCGKFRKNPSKKDWTDYCFGKLRVVREVPKPEHLKNPGAYWECQCECGNTVVIKSTDITRKSQLSCGKCSTNTFDVSGSFGIGRTVNGEEFYFDKEDYELIKKYSWSKTKAGYIMAWDTILQRFIYLHRLLTGLLDDKEYVVDHRNHNTVDNQKENLRVCTHQENIMNSKISKNNTSGVVGVIWNSNINKWGARIMVNYKTINIGYYENFEDAVIARRQAEEKYFGEFAYKYDNKGD